MTRSLLLSDSCGFVDLGHPVWQEDGSVVYNSCWPSPAQSFSGPSPIGLVAIFYCHRFETSLFVASYDSQGHGGGIQPRLHTGDETHLHDCPHYITLAQTAWETTFLTVTLYYLHIHCCRNVFIEPLLSTGHLMWLHSSSFQTSCHTVLKHFFFLILNTLSLVILHVPHGLPLPGN
jgi:hypothetical protein